MAEQTSLVESQLHGTIQVGSSHDLEALRNRQALAYTQGFDALLVHRQVSGVDQRYPDYSVGGLGQVAEAEAAHMA